MDRLCEAMEGMKYVESDAASMIDEKTMEGKKCVDTNATSKMEPKSEVRSWVSSTPDFVRFFHHDTDDCT